VESIREGLRRPRVTVETGEGSPHVSNQAEKTRLAASTGIEARYAVTGFGNPGFV
jgi:hypothetical protein